MIDDDELISNLNITKKFQQEYFAKPQHVSTKYLDAYYEAAHKQNSGGKYLMASIKAHYTDNGITHALKKLDIPLYLISKYLLSPIQHLTVRFLPC